MSNEFLEYIREEYLEDLYELDLDDPYYPINRGELYEDVRSSANVGDKDAVQMSRLLERGEVSEVEEKLEELLIE